MVSFVFGPALQGLGRKYALRYRLNEGERMNSLGVSRRDKGERIAARKPSRQGRATHADRVHDGENVVGLLFERRYVRNVLRQTETSALKVHGPREAGHALHVVIYVRVHQLQVQVMENLIEVHNIGWTVANYLVGHRSPVTVDVLRGHRVHVRQRIRVGPRSPLLPELDCRQISVSTAHLGDEQCDG
jgi:hypothetical protein